MTSKCLTRFVFGLALVITAAPRVVRGQEFEQEPIRYSRSRPANRASRLLDQIAAGEKSLPHEVELGYLRALLAELAVPVSSQTLVYSKTSLQRQRISPRMPRALYFSDD